MSSRQPKILIFDDRRKAGPLAEIILATGMHAEITSVISRGIEICSETDFEAVIVDTDFNRGVGLEFITALRELSRNQFAPVVAMSRAKPQSEIKSTTEAQAAGADEFLKRPIKRSKVLSRLTKILGREIKVIEQPSPKPASKKGKKKSSRKPKATVTKRTPKSSLSEEKAKLSEFQTPVEAERSRTFAKKLNALRKDEDESNSAPTSGLVDHSKDETPDSSTTKASVENQSVPETKATVGEAQVNGPSAQEDSLDSSKLPEPIANPSPSNQLDVNGTQISESLNSDKSDEYEPITEGEVAGTPSETKETASFIGEAFFDDLDDLSSENEMNFVDLVQHDHEEEGEAQDVVDPEVLGRESTDPEASGLMGVLEAELERRDEVEEEENLPVPIAVDSPPSLSELELAEEDSVSQEEASPNTDEVQIPPPKLPEQVNATPAARRVRTAYGMMAEMLADKPVSSETEILGADSNDDFTTPEKVHIPPRSQRNDIINEETNIESQAHTNHAEAGWNADQIAKVTAGVIAAAESSAKEAVQEAFSELFSRLPPALFQTPEETGTEDVQKSRTDETIADSQEYEASAKQTSDDEEANFGHEKLLEADIDPGSLLEEQRISPARFTDETLPVDALAEEQKPSDEIIGDGVIGHLFDALLLVDSLRENSPSGRLCLGDHIVIEIEGGLPVCRSGADVTTRLLLRLLDDGHIRPSEYDELMRSGIEERPDRILTYLADSSRLTPKETWKGLDRLVDEALSTIVRHKGSWTFFSENRRAKSAQSSSDGQIEIRSRLAKVVQEAFGASSLIQMFGTTGTIIEVTQWPGDFVSPGDRSFLQALDGATTFEQACTVGGMNSDRAAALVVLLLAMGFARIIVGEQSEVSQQKLDVPAWSGAMVEDFRKQISDSPPALESANDDVVSSVPAPPSSQEDSRTVSKEIEQVEDSKSSHSKTNTHSFVSTAISDADAIVSEAEFSQTSHSGTGVANHSDLDAPETNSPEQTVSFIASNSVEGLFSRIKTRSYYEVLGVVADAEMNEITAAYDERLEELSDLLIDLRPDRLLMAEKITQVYREAFIVLSHKHLQERYRYFQQSRDKQ